MQRTTVQLGYISVGAQLQRTLVDSAGRVFVDGTWGHTDAQVTAVPGTYARCWDVPRSWLGFVPWWPTGPAPVRREVVLRPVSWFA